MINNQALEKRVFFTNKAMEKYNNTYEYTKCTDCMNTNQMYN